MGSIDPLSEEYTGAQWRFYADGAKIPTSVFGRDLTTPVIHPSTADRLGRFGPVFFDANTEYRGICSSADGEVIHAINPILTYATPQIAPHAKVLGYLPSSTGALPSVTKPPAGRVVQAVEFGISGQGLHDDTAALATALRTAAGGVLVLPAGTINASQIAVPSHTALLGQGIGRTIIRQAPGIHRPLLTSGVESTSPEAIRIEGFTVDGSGVAKIRPTNGVVINGARRSFIEIEVINCRGHGVVLSGGGHNTFGRAMVCRDNGRGAPGYGLYLFGSSDNLILGGQYDRNCIGIAVEASGPGMRADHNILLNVQCRENRADFAQSGAGLHFEQSNGGICSENQVLGGHCVGSSGVGIVNSGTDVILSAAEVRNNGGAGVATLIGRAFVYTGLSLQGNGSRQSAGYRAEMIFDDSGLEHGSAGLVAKCKLRGNAPDGGIKSMSTGSTIEMRGNEVSGYRVPYNVHGKGDRVHD